MRIVDAAPQFAAALDGARREAASAFGDGRVLIEKYLKSSRHIEVQVFADRHGNTVHIFDRDCSIQRRHQKIIEEAPAPKLEAERRERMSAAALAAAQAVNYVGAGTVEFIAPAGPAGAFYFIEMNTRLQVEHAVTEAVSGLDLVEWQLRVAAGEPLPLRQPDLVRRGHAIEARLYAEDPERNFLPQTGTLHRLHLPPAEIARVDTGVCEGDAVTPFYDPMIAKIIVWGEDRPIAAARLQRALAETAVLGVRTNLGFLSRVAADPDFFAGRLDTGFIERRHAALLPPRRPAPDEALFAVALSRLEKRREAATAQTAQSGDPFSPWASRDGWRLGAGRNQYTAAPQEIVLRDGADARTVMAAARGRGWLLRLGDREVAASVERRADGGLAILLDGVGRRLGVLDHGAEAAVFSDGGSWSFEETDPLMPPAGADLPAGKLTAPMPGRVTRLLVEPGAKVRRGEPLVVIEAMKMEHTVTAPTAGVVTAVRFAAGDMVEEGAELIALAPAGDNEA
jgi:3-methylcrotonyl-CoA carboxylase alpha subunit